MKFVAPEIEVRKFDVSDVLTTSGQPSAFETPAEGACAGNDSDWGLNDCI